MQRQAASIATEGQAPVRRPALRHERVMRGDVVTPSHETHRAPFQSAESS